MIVCYVDDAGIAAQWFAEFAHSQVPVVYHWFIALYPEVNMVPLGQPHDQGKVGNDGV